MIRRSRVVMHKLVQGVRGGNGVDAEEKEQIAQYIKGYTEQPQTEEEFGWSDYVTIEALKDIPWEGKP